jgi:hypothetical protein
MLDHMGNSSELGPTGNSKALLHRSKVSSDPYHLLRIAYRWDRKGFSQEPSCSINILRPSHKRHARVICTIFQDSRAVIASLVSLQRTRHPPKWLAAKTSHLTPFSKRGEPKTFRKCLSHRLNIDQQQCRYTNVVRPPTRTWSLSSNGGISQELNRQPDHHDRRRSSLTNGEANRRQDRNVGECLSTLAPDGSQLLLMKSL